MPDPLSWPTNLLAPSNVKLSLVSASRGGGQTIDGNEQVVASPASQRWALTYSGLAIRNRVQIQVLRAIEAMLDGRSNTIALPIYDSARPLPVVFTTFSDGATFADGSRFRQGGTVGALAADAARNATTLSITWDGQGPVPGQHFSIGQRLYRIASISVTGNASGTVVIRPWLREAAPAASTLNFDRPVVLARLAKDDGLALDLQLWRFATLSVDFVEAT